MYARIVLGIGLVALLIYFVGLGDVWDRVETLPLWFLPFGLLYYAGCQVVSTRRWQVLLLARGVRRHFWLLFDLYMIGMFANNFLPGAVGGDVVKAVGLYRNGGPGDVSAASVLVERFLGLAALGAIGLAASIPAMAMADGDPVIILATIGTALVIAGAGAVVWFPPLAQMARRVLSLARFGKGPSLVVRLFDATNIYWSRRRELLWAFILSIVLQTLIGLYYELTAQAMGVDLPIIYFFAFLPVITLVSMAPISIGGLGVREVAMVFLFGRVGVASADILTVSLTVHALNTILSLVGGFLLVRQWRQWKTH
jgi:uncharacterized protein (TIRG00374 family)